MDNNVMIKISILKNLNIKPHFERKKSFCLSDISEPGRWDNIDAGEFYQTDDILIY